MADIKYLINVDAAGAIKTMKEFDDTLDQTAKSSDKAETAHKGLWKQIAIGELAYNAAVKAGRFMVGFLKDTITASMEAEKVDKALAASLEITGRPVEDLTRHFKAYASQLQAATTYGDEEIKSAQTLLVQLTNLDKDGLDRATKGAIGLASVMGMDLESSAQLVAKAMSGNTAMLSRYGITVDQTKTKEEQRAEIMAKLEQFYGRATAETETYGGKLKQLKEKYGDIQEEVGNYITKNHALMDSLNGIADAILYQLTLGDKLASQKRTQEENENRWADSLARTAVEANLQYGEMQKLTAAYNHNMAATARAISQGKHGEELQKALNKVRKEELVQFQELERARKKAEHGTNKITDATKKETKSLQEELKAIRDASKQFRLLTDGMDGISQESGPLFEASIEGGTGELINMDEAISKVNANAKKSFSYMADVVAEFWAKYGQHAQDAIYAVDAVVIQSHKNKEIKLDNEYKKAVERIEQSKMNEEEKAAAMAALDEEYDKKRSALKAKQANQDKLMSIIQATISTYEGAAKAFAQGGIFGHIFGAIIVAAGLALVAKIKAQPIPLAKGAIYTQPTILPAMDGQDRLVGEAGTEIVATPENIRKALQLDKKGRSTSQQGATFYMTVPIYIGRDKVQEVLLQIVHDGAASGRLTISPKAVR